MTRGSCWLEVADVDEPLELTEGEIVLLVTGRSHQLRDDLSSTVEWLDDILGVTPVDHGRMTYGGTGRITELVCGGLILEGESAAPALLTLPPLIRLSSDDSDEWLTKTLELLRLEAGAKRPGAEAVLTRIADLLLTHTIRTYLSSLAGEDGSAIGVLREPRIAKTIRLISDDPAHDWSVDELAAEAAMSQSSFFARFRELTGESPMRYVARCRLARAALLLGQTDATLSEIAHRTGYRSEASLARAFTRIFGLSPGSYRKGLRDPELAHAISVVPEFYSDS